jgi:hypothetical protein
MGLPHSPVRYRPDVGFEMRCPVCTVRGDERYWPLTVEFWWPARGMSRCRACWRAERTAQQRCRRRRPGVRVREIAKMRAYRRGVKLRALRALARAEA